MTLVSTAARAASSGGGAITQLFSLSLASPGTFDQASIPQTYNDLYIVGKFRGVAASVLSTGALQLNGDTAGNYDMELLSAFAATASAGETLGNTEINLGNMPGGSATAAMYATVEILIAGYASTTWQKTVGVRTYTHAANTTTNVIPTNVSGHWRNTAAVTRITASIQSAQNLATGSTLRIYGIT